jgi:hypothetical protein
MCRFAYLCCCTAAVLSGCRKSERPASGETTAAAVPAPAAATPAPAGIRLADVAGKWAVRVLSQAGDSTLLTLTLTATADTMGWAIAFKNGPTVPVHVLSVSGDSIVTEAGPHASQLRKGLQVKTHTVYRLHGDTLVGTTVAHYRTQKPDSVRTTQNRATRTQ